MTRKKSKSRSTGAAPDVSENAGSVWSIRAILAMFSFASLAMLGILLRPLYYGEVFVGGDLLSFNIPIRVFYGKCLERGEPFLWFPYILCGFDLHGEGQAGMLHPLHLALYRYCSLTAAINLEIWLSFPAMLLGNYLFLARQGVRREGAIWGAFAFAFSAFTVVHTDHPNILAVIAHVPWLLIAIDLVLSSASTGYALAGAGAVALLGGSQILLGHPQSFWFSMLIEVWYVLLRLPRWMNWRRGVLLVFGQAIALGVGTVQWWPTYDLLSLSQRAVADEAFRSLRSLHPLQLLEHLAPYLFENKILVEDGLPASTEWAGAYEVYLQPFAPIALVWVLVRWRELGSQRSLGIGAIVLWFIGTALACGRFLPWLHWVVLKLPVIGLFRGSFHYLAVTSFAMSLVIAVAAADLGALVRERKRVAWSQLAWLSLPVLAAVAACVWALSIREITVTEVPWRVASLAKVSGCVALILIAALLAAASARGCAAALVALACWSIGTQMLFVSDDPIHGQTLALAPLIEPLPTEFVDPQYRIWSPPGFPNDNTLSMRDGRLATGYSALVPRYQVLRDANLQKQHNWLVVRLACIRWLFFADGRQQQVPDTLPRARLVGRAQHTDQPATTLPTIDPRLVALVDEEIELRDSEPGVTTIISDRPGETRIEVDAPAEQLLVFTETWHPGWRAFVGERSLPIYRAYGDFMACRVPAGKLTVTFRYVPRSFAIGQLISLAAAGLATLGVSAGIAIGYRNSKSMAQWSG